MVEGTGIATMKNVNIFDYKNNLADIAKVDKLTQDQIGIAHRRSKKQMLQS